MKQIIFLILWILSSPLFARDPQQIHLDIVVETRRLEKKIGVFVDSYYYPCDEAALLKLRQQVRAIETVWPLLPPPLVENIEKIVFVTPTNGISLGAQERITFLDIFNKISGRTLETPVLLENPPTVAQWLFCPWDAEFIGPGYHLLTYQEGEAVLFVDNLYPKRLLLFRNRTLYINPLCDHWDEGGVPLVGWGSHLEDAVFSAAELTEFLIYILFQTHQADIKKYLQMIENPGLKERAPLPFPSQEEDFQRFGYWILRYQRQLKNSLSQTQPNETRWDRYQYFLKDEENFYAQLLYHFDQLDEKKLEENHKERILDIESLIRETEAKTDEFQRAVEEFAPLEEIEGLIAKILKNISEIRHKTHEARKWGINIERISEFLKMSASLEEALVTEIQKLQTELEFRLSPPTEEEVAELSAYVTSYLAPVTLEDSPESQILNFPALRNLKDAIVQNRDMLTTQLSKNNPIEEIIIAKGSISFRIRMESQTRDIVVSGGLSPYGDPIPYPDREILDAYLKHILRKRP